MAGVGEAPRHVGVDELVDHDPRRYNPLGEGELHGRGCHVERTEPRPHRPEAEQPRPGV